MTAPRLTGYDDPRPSLRAGVFSLAFTRLEVLIHMVLPEGAGGRLGRIFGVDTRTGQRWSKGEMGLPAEVSDWLETQQKSIAAAGDLRRPIEELVDRMRAAGVHDEAIGAYLAAAHNNLLGRTIR